MKIIILMTAVILLSACSHSHILKKQDSDFTYGKLIHDQGEKNSLVLDINNKQYKAEGFLVKRDRNLAELSKKYRMANRKHWIRIMSGLDKRHTSYSAKIIVIANDGDQLSCELAWQQGKDHVGICIGKDKRELAIVF